MNDKRVFIFFTFCLLLAADSIAQSFSRNSYKICRCYEQPIEFVVPNGANDSLFRATVIKYWTLGHKISFISENDSLRDENSIQATFRSVQINGGDITHTFRLVYKGRLLLLIRLDEQLGPRDLMYILKTSHKILSNHANWKKKYVWKEMPKLYGNQMAEKTLLIPKQFVDKLTPEEIRSVYPYRFIIANDAKIEEAVYSESNEYLVMYFSRQSWNDGNSSPIKLIYSPKGGEIIAYSFQTFLPNKYVPDDLELEDFTKFLKSTKKK